MNWAEVAFIIVGIGTLLCAIRMVTTRNVMHGALYLALTLGGTAGMFILLGAPFLAWVQVLVYVGAVVVLMMFALMLTKAPIGRQALDNTQRLGAALVSLGCLGGLAVVLTQGFEGQQIDPSAAAAASAGIGEAIFARFVLPFEVVSILLLAALIGAIVLAKKDES